MIYNLGYDILIYNQGYETNYYYVSTRQEQKWQSFVYCIQLPSRNGMHFHGFFHSIFTFQQVFLQILFSTFCHYFITITHPFSDLTIYLKYSQILKSRKGKIQIQQGIVRQYSIGPGHLLPVPILVLIDILNIYRNKV